MAQTILYYPNINITDGQWLRNALLYWDNISSIVPYRNFEGLSPELLYLKEEGSYTPIYPQDLFKSNYNSDFEEMFIKKLENYEKSKSSKRVKIHKNKIQSPELSSLIHNTKIPSKLYRILDNKNYINDYDSDGWMEVDEKIAQIYMKTLAQFSIKSSNKDIVLGTDTESKRREVYTNTWNYRVDSQCCEINIINCLPQPSPDTSLEDIIVFKTQRKDELQAFRSKIKEFETNIYRSNSIEEIKHYENSFVESWESCSREYYRVLNESKIPCVMGNICTLVALPLAEQLLTRIGMQDLISPIQNGIGLLSIAINSINYRNIVNSHNIDSGFAYIIKANEYGLINL